MKTIAKQLNVTEFPFIIKNKDGKEIYLENSDGYWIEREYDVNGKEIYRETSNDIWFKKEYDANGKEIYYEDSYGYWSKHEYDVNGKVIYYENSRGDIKDNRPKQKELSNLESIEEWEIKITSLVEDYKQLTACCDAAYDAGALDANGKLYTAIWNTYDNMLEHIDVAGWISWYIFDNDCGAKAMKASYGDEINAIKTPLDLARLIVADQNKTKN